MPPEADAVSARVVPFRRRDERIGERLCARGFHHWEIAIAGPYQAVGRTPILWRCKRCGAGCEGPTPGAWPGERRPSQPPGS